MSRHYSHQRALIQFRSAIGAPGLVVEFVIGVPVLLIIYTLAAMEYPRVSVPKVRLVEVMNTLPMIKVALVADYADRGEWPEGSAFLRERAFDQISFAGLEGYQVVNGSINLAIDPEEALGIDPAAWGIESPILNLSLIRTVPDSGRSHFPSWTCGYADPIAGHRRIAVPNLTNFPPELLPPVCR